MPEKTAKWKSDDSNSTVPAALGFKDSESREADVECIAIDLKAGLHRSRFVRWTLRLEVCLHDSKSMLLTKLREYKTDLNNLKTNVNRISSANLNQAARDDLLELGMSDAMTVVALNTETFLVPAANLDLENSPIPEFPPNEVVLDVITIEDVIGELLQGLHSRQKPTFRLDLSLQTEGPKLVRSPATIAKIMTDPSSTSSIRCEIKLPSGEKKWINKSCRAIVGPQWNAGQRKKKLRKAGQSRWLGIRPKVRGVAMNPVDHPHGGGEGKSKSSGSHGKGSRTPWGKPTKGGYKTRSPKKKNII
ncbi:OLC1v1008301C1 [Oldenlandia corymbosa var. corymbosa]|uniref:OLC1v1008301C1 n=1 Tax=Oldenlandia corymbosa var. corymbosa TaxID=529605 RepID=A0AAV1DPL2_OLDCO|nr:OLC1v1008301C1 [Oldenlandia corymbosa var. corymbosa]